MSLKKIPPDVQVMKAAELKELQQHVAKARYHHQRCTTQLYELQDVGVHLLVKEFVVL